MTNKFDKLYEDFVAATKYCNDKKGLVKDKAKPGAAAYDNVKNVDRIKVKQPAIPKEAADPGLLDTTIKPGEAAVADAKNLAGEKDQNKKPKIKEDTCEDDACTGPECDPNKKKVTEESDDDLDNQNTSETDENTEQTEDDMDEPADTDKFVATLNKTK